MLKSFIPALFVAVPLFLSAQVQLKLNPWATGFDRPVDVAHCGDSRIFVVEQDGIIWTLDSLGAKLDTFLNIDPRVNSTGNEQGLLGLAFHPNYAQNGYFFVHYTKSPSGATQVSRFSRSANNPNEADPNSELSVLTAVQPFSNHNGGCIKFGPDGYLYIGIGDGGSGGDPQGNGQKTTTFLGKILRIDVNNSSQASPYVVPGDNPFVGQSNYLPEIWSLGWRNPWRFSFDRLNGDMWVGDVGQVTREEVDYEPAGMGGRNYGWRCYEGTVAHITTGCNPQNSYVGPVFDYDNSSMGCSMTGGFIYRGSLYPALYGTYLNADYCSGRIWGTKRNANGSFSTVQLVDLDNNEFSSFGEDKNGELYICMLAKGEVRKIVDKCGAFQVSASNIVSPVCEQSFSGLIALNVNNGTGSVTYAWSNGNTDYINPYLNPGTFTVTVTNGDGCSVVQSYEILQQGPDRPTLTANDTMLCLGDNLILTARDFPAGSQLAWYKNGVLFLTTPTDTDVHTLIVSPLIAGTYKVLLVDTLCNLLYSESVTVSVEAPVLPLVNVGGDTLFAEGPCVSCQWLFNGQPIPGATSDFYIATFSGVYVLQTTSPNGCVYGSEEVTLTISETALPASVKKFKLSPNPAENSALLEMDLNKSERFLISLSDTNQRQMFKQSKQAQQIALPIDMRSLAPGVYFLKVELESGSFVRRLVKQ